MPHIRHINIADAEGQAYCCLRNRVVRLDEEHRNNYCAGCKMFEGTAGGRGVECAWDDARDVANPHIAADPLAEWRSNQARKIKPHREAFISDWTGTYLAIYS